MSTNNPDRTESTCINCGQARASHYGLWCGECWEDLDVQAKIAKSGNTICWTEDCDHPAAAGTVFCHTCLAFYTPDAVR